MCVDIRPAVQGFLGLSGPVFLSCIPRSLWGTTRLHSGPRSFCSVHISFSSIFFLKAGHDFLLSWRSSNWSACGLRRYLYGWRQSFWGSCGVGVGWVVEINNFLSDTIKHELLLVLMPQQQNQVDRLDLSIRWFCFSGNSPVCSKYYLKSQSETLENSLCRGIDFNKWALAPLSWRQDQGWDPERTPHSSTAVQLFLNQFWITWSRRGMDH